MNMYLYVCSRSQPVRHVHEVQFASEPEAAAYSKVHRDESPTSSETSSDEEAVLSVDLRRRKRELAKFRANVVSLHNRYRKAHGLDRLHRNRELDASAAKWAEALLMQQSLNNSNHLYKNLRVGENIASRRSNAPCDYTGTLKATSYEYSYECTYSDGYQYEHMHVQPMQCSRRGGRTLVPRAEQVPVRRRAARRAGHRCVPRSTRACVHVLVHGYNSAHMFARTGNFTQMLWRGSSEIGVGKAVKQDPATGATRVVVVCHYFPGARSSQPPALALRGAASCCAEIATATDIAPPFALSDATCTHAPASRSRQRAHSVRRERAGAQVIQLRRASLRLARSQCSASRRPRRVVLHTARQTETGHRTPPVLPSTTSTFYTQSYSYSTRLVTPSSQSSSVMCSINSCASTLVPITSAQFSTRIFTGEKLFRNSTMHNHWGVICKTLLTEAGESN